MNNKYVSNIKNNLQYPLIYASGFSSLTGIIKGVNSLGGNDLEQALQTGGSTALENFPFFLGVNLLYAKGVELTTRKWGRCAANAFCVAVNVGFYAYASATQDANPTYQAMATTILGLGLTNKQVSDIQQEN